MAFDRPSKHVGVFVCDICGEEIEITSDEANLSSAKECWDYARSEKWALRAGEHYCPSCAGLES